MTHYFIYPCHDSLAGIMLYQVLAGQERAESREGQKERLQRRQYIGPQSEPELPKVTRAVVDQK